MARPSAIRVPQHGQPRRQISRSPGRPRGRLDVRLVPTCRSPGSHSWPPKLLLGPDERPRQANLLGRLDARSITRATSSRGRDKTGSPQTQPQKSVRGIQAGAAARPLAPAGLLSHVDRPQPGLSSSFRCSTVSPLHVVVAVVVVVVDVVAIAPVSFLSRAIARRYQMQPCIDEEPRLALAVAQHIAVTRPACVCARACLGF